VVNRCGRYSAVNRCEEAWSAGAERGQPVPKTWSAGAENAVNRCRKRGQQVRRSTDFTNVLKVLRVLPDLPDLPDLSRKGEREESRWRRALPLTRHAATGFSLHTGLFHRWTPAPRRRFGGRGGIPGFAPAVAGCPDGHRISRRRGRVSSPGTRPPCQKRRPTRVTADRSPTAARQPVHRPATSPTRSTSSKLRYG